jgi:hypothetical protein
MVYGCYRERERVSVYREWIKPRITLWNRHVHRVEWIGQRASEIMSDELAVTHMQDVAKILWIALESQR